MELTAYTKYIVSKNDWLIWLIFSPFIWHERVNRIYCKIKMLIILKMGYFSHHLLQ